MFIAFGFWEKVAYYPYAVTYLVSFQLTASCSGAWALQSREQTHFILLFSWNFLG